MHLQSLSHQTPRFGTIMPYHGNNADKVISDMDNYDAHGALITLEEDLSKNVETHQFIANGEDAALLLSLDHDLQSEDTETAMNVVGDILKLLGNKTASSMVTAAAFVTKLTISSKNLIDQPIVYNRLPGFNPHEDIDSTSDSVE